MKITIEGDAKEIAELLATSIRHNDKPVTLGQVLKRFREYKSQSDVAPASTLDLPAVVVLTLQEGVRYI